MKDQLLFDTTDVDTIADSDSVGAYVRSSDGTLITHTTDGTDERLDVQTELGQSEDAAHVSGDTGIMALVVRSDAGGSLVSADGDYSALQVDASGALRVNATVNVDALSDYAEDSAHTTGDIGGYVLAVRQDTLAASVSTDGDYASFKVDAVGSLYTKDSDAAALLTTIDAVLDTIKVDTGAMVVDLAAIEVEQLAQGVSLDSIFSDTSSIDGSITALSKAEDSSHVSGDQGIMGLAVRNDAGSTLVSADGDYSPLSINATGSLYTHITGSDLLTVSDAALANIAVKNNALAITTASVRESLVASALASRKYLHAYNSDNRKMYIGSGTVTVANGFPVSPGSYIELRAGAAVDVQVISEKVGHDIRTLELS